MQKDWIPAFAGRRKGHFSDERSSHSEKSLGVSPEWFTSFLSCLKSTYQQPRKHFSIV